MNGFFTLLVPSTCLPTRNGSWNFRELDGWVVYVGNGNPCNILGIGTIRLKNQDGSTRAPTDVHYVLDVKKNLMSLGVLESKCFTVSMQSAELKIISGILVAMKDIWKNNLYYYQGSTIIGSTMTVVSEKDKDLKITMVVTSIKFSNGLDLISIPRIWVGARRSICRHI